MQVFLKWGVCSADAEQIALKLFASPMRQRLYSRLGLNQRASIYVSGRGGRAVGRSTRDGMMQALVGRMCTISVSCTHKASTDSN